VISVLTSVLAPVLGFYSGSYSRVLFLFLGPIPVLESYSWLLDSSDYHLQRLPRSSACHSPAPAILQRLPLSSACHSPAPAILQRLPFSSAYHSPALAILQRLPFSSACHSPVPAILQRLPFNRSVKGHKYVTFSSGPPTNSIPGAEEVA
jgi:hypothetical protein